MIRIKATVETLTKSLKKRTLEKGDGVQDGQERTKILKRDMTQMDVIQEEKGPTDAMLWSKDPSFGSMEMDIVMEDDPDLELDTCSLVVHVDDLEPFSDSDEDGNRVPLPDLLDFPQKFPAPSMDATEKVR